MMALDTESRTTESDHLALRLWLRMLACTKRIERHVSSGLRAQGTTLPRFDFLAQLERYPDGLRMTDVSRRMMVTAGNITRLADQLLADGLISREPAPDDRRAWIVQLTAAGRASFAAVAAEHERWIAAMFDQLSDGERRTLFVILARLKEHVADRAAETAVMNRTAAYAGYDATNFRWRVSGGVASLTLDRPERKNPLTFAAYAELRDLFAGLSRASDVHAIVIEGAGGNFCSGGDVHEIIGPLTRMSAPELLAFTQMTGDVVKAMRACPQPIVAAVDGVCAGAGAMLALAADVRFGTPAARTAFLFTRVGLAGADMGACTLLPRTIGHGRAAELLFSGRVMDAHEALAWGFFNRLCEPSTLAGDALAFAQSLARGPTFGHAMTKAMLHREWAMPLDEAIDAEAHAQALCMQTADFRRAYDAFVEKRAPAFEGD